MDRSHARTFGRTEPYPCVCNIPQREVDGCCLHLLYGLPWHEAQTKFATPADEIACTNRDLRNGGNTLHRADRWRWLRHGAPSCKRRKSPPPQAAPLGATPGAKETPVVG